MEPAEGAKELIASLQWRYATKKFDPSQQIPEETWNALEESLVLTASSYGMQPWRFWVITEKGTKEGLVEACYHQRQVADCSHLLVIAVQTEVTEGDVDKLIQTTATVRGKDPESLEGYRKMILGDVVHGSRGGDVVRWAKLQGYIALGNFLTGAALLRVDTCPMEGFESAKVDKVLGLGEAGLTAAVLCPAGYRAEDDGYAAAPKIRYGSEDLVTHV
ncbi:MAG: NAD(P)H-dependent oxidoreductase [Verrucomicrobiota bacterium]